MNKTKFVIWGLILAACIASKEMDNKAGYEKTSGYVYQSTSQSR